MRYTRSGDCAERAKPKTAPERDNIYTPAHENTRSPAPHPPWATIDETSNTKTIEETEAPTNPPNYGGSEVDVPSGRIESRTRGLRHLHRYGTTRSSGFEPC